MFTRARHRSLSCARSIQSIPLHHISVRSIVIFSSHLRLGPSSGLFPSGLLTKTLYVFRFVPMHATCPVRFILLELVILLIVQFPKTFYYVTSLASKYSPQDPFSNTLRLCSLNVRDHVSHPYKITAKIIILYALIFTFLDSRRECERL
jgi:hypothetical protein